MNNEEKNKNEAFHPYDEKIDQKSEKDKKSFDAKELDQEEIVEERNETTEESKKDFNIIVTADPSNENVANGERPQYNSAAAAITNLTNLSESDLELITDFGFESDLKRIVGVDSVKKYKMEKEGKSSKAKIDGYWKPYGYAGKEYKEKEQDKRILKKFRSEKSVIIQKLVFSIFFIILTIIMENEYFINNVFVRLPAKLQGVWLIPTIELLALLVMMILSKTELYNGLADMFKYTTTEHSMLAVYSIFTFLYQTAIVGHFIMCPGVPLEYFHSVMLCIFAIFTGSLSDLLRICSDQRTFKIVSSNESKYVLESQTDRKKKIKRRDHFVRVTNEFSDKNYYQVSKAKQITGIFRRSRNMAEVNVHCGILLGVMVILPLFIALVSSVISFFTIEEVTFDKNMLEDALAIFYKCFSIASPVGIALCFSYPYARANRILYSRASTLVGEESVNEYSGENKVIVSDEDLFRVETVIVRALASDELAKRAKSLVKALFNELGGALGKALNEDPAKKFEVKVLAIRDNGIEAIVDNTLCLVGNEAFFKKKKIEIDCEQQNIMEQNFTVLYVAIKDKPALRYVLAYSPCDSFKNNESYMESISTGIVVSTYDPNLNNAFIQLIRPNDAKSIQVIKPTFPELEKELDIVDTGIVALDSKNDVLAPIAAAKAIKKTRKKNVLFQFWFILFGMIVTAVTHIFGIFNTTSIEKSYITIPTILVFQMLCMTIVFVLTSLQIREETLIDEGKSELLDD